MESTAEAERLAQRRRLAASGDPERRGETLLDLVIADHQIGLGGHYLLTLVKRNRDMPMPWHRLRVGSPVVMSDADDPDQPAYQGVVSGRRATSIEVALDEWPDGDRFQLDLSADEVTRHRQRAALQSAQQARGRQAELRRVLLGDRLPRFDAQPEVEFRALLNPSQQEAVRFALAARDVAILHGPPGTGKTTTVVEFIRHAVARGQKVLACAPSNPAVDNLLERLIAADVRVVRIGHPARVQADLQSHTLDALVQQDEAMRVVTGMMRDAERLYQKASRHTRARPARGAKQDLRREARQLQKDARQYEQSIIRNVLRQADCICATATADLEILNAFDFDLTVIDEACQSTEPGCWIPLLRADRLVLAGDHCQLPPTVLSDQAAREGFDVSLMQRLVQTYGDAVTRRLDVQYRMHSQIMQFSSQQFYDGQLIADPTVREHLLADLPQVQSDPLTCCAVAFLDTAGAGWEEQLEPEGLSRRNVHEAQLVLQTVGRLVDAGLAPRDIAVIAPYAAQVRLLRDQAEHAELEIDTVDGFQGREKEAVVISLVRSNQMGEIGFLGDTRRMNVALTRARRKLIVIGDSATLAAHPFYADLLQYIESIGAYQTVWETME